MKKIFSLVLATLAATTMAFAAVQQVSETVGCNTQKTIKATPKTGYHFVQWNDANTENPRTVTVGTENVTYIATFAPNTNTAYTVKHFLQNLDESYPAEPYATDNLTGTTATATAAEAHEYPGYLAQAIVQGTIAGDGSTVVEVKYVRQSYTLTWVTDGDELTGAYTTGSVKFGADITAPNTPTKTGYVFDGWNESVSATMPAGNTTYTATWTPATNTKYTVKHFQQNVENDEYTEVTADAQELEGTTGQLTAAEAKEYEGFDAKAFSQIEIAADGSAVVNIYYDRKKYTVTFLNAEGDLTPLQTIENVKYGAEPVYSGATPTKAEDEDNTYEHLGWNPAIAPITGNTTYVATFTAVPKCKATITIQSADEDMGTVEFVTEP